MNARNRRSTAIAVLIAAFLPFHAAQAQLGDLLKQGGSSASGATGGVGGLGGVSEIGRAHV